MQEVVQEAQKNPETPVRVRNGAGWEGEIEAAWLRPVIKSPRELKTLLVRPEDLRYLVFMPPDDVRHAIDNGQTPPLDQYPHAKAYIEWGVWQGYHLRPTCASRKWWWDLGNREAAFVNCNYLLDDRMRFYFSPNGVYVSDNFQELHGADVLTAALLGCPATQILCELGGRTPFGGGLLKVQTYEVETLFMLNPICLSTSNRRKVISAFHRLSQRPIRSIFEELGYPKPNKDYSNIDPDALTLEQVKQASPDRYELDSVIFDVLGLTDEERLMVYRAVVQLVKDRLVKAKSV